ncbi:MAG TPA: YdcF family protein [Rhizomicrobium sp.]|nr:YdcF family protein [Rhizomicrobium sp.]
MRGFLVAMLLIALAYGLGFVAFVSLLPKTPADLSAADGIVVLTGGDTRLDRADALLESGVGKRLLISGVDQATTKETLKHLIHAGPRFDCCADLGYAAEDTRGNAQEAADWARIHHLHRLILVTARYHMPRSLEEFSAAMPSVQFLPYPVEQESINLADWWDHPRTIFLLHREYAKYLVSLITTRMARA